MSKFQPAFWKEKKLHQLSNLEWEALCDGCGQCCLHKLEDADTGEIAYTNVSCRLLELETCRCQNYPKRKTLVPDCVILKPEYVDQFKWLPVTCAYRLISEGKDLLDWHPLISGSVNSVHDAGISVAKYAVSEREAGDLQDHIISIEEYTNE